MGHLLASAGKNADPDKVEALIKMPAPVDTSGVHCLCGCVNHMAQFLPHFTDTVASTHVLTRKDVPFKWAEAQSKVFPEVRRLVSMAPGCSNLAEKPSIGLHKSSSH